MEYTALRAKEDLEDDCEIVDTDKEKKRLARRRQITLASIATLFLLSATLLTLSVVHDIKAKARDPGWEEFSCKENDAACLELLCPTGMLWDREVSQCKQLPGEEVIELDVYELKANVCTVNFVGKYSLSSLCHKLCEHASKSLPSSISFDIISVIAELRLKPT